MLRSLRYVWRDPKTKAAWVTSLAIGLIVPLFNALQGTGTIYFACFASGMLGIQMYNQFGQDTSAFWMVAHDDLLAPGRLPGAAGAGAGAAADHAAVRGAGHGARRPRCSATGGALPEALGLSFALLGAMLATGAVTSARFPYSIPQDSGYKNVAPGQAGLAWISIFGGMVGGAAAVRAGAGPDDLAACLGRGRPAVAAAPAGRGVRRGVAAGRPAPGGPADGGAAAGDPGGGQQGLRGSWYVVPVIPPRDGRNLKASVDREDPARTDGSVATDIALEVLIDAFDALAAVHAKGLVHRILSPQRIWLGQGMRVLFSDFYIARIEGQQSVALWTDDEDGKPYRAPECQDTLVTAGKNSDVFSLARSLTGWLTGDVSLDLESSIAWLSNQGAVGELLTTCLDADPVARPSADEAASQLKQVAQPVPAVEASADQPAEDLFQPGGLIEGRYRIKRCLGPVVWPLHG